MNKKGMMAQLIGAFVIVLIAVALAPIVMKQVGELQMSSQSNYTTYGDQSFTTMITVLPYLMGAIVLAVVIFMVISALRSAGMGRGVDGVDSNYTEDEDTDDETDSEDEDSNEEYDEESDDEEDEDEAPQPKRKHTTMVITKKRDGKVKTNVTLSPTGYNVDKYQLDKTPDSKLSYKEENFKKTKFD